MNEHQLIKKYCEKFKALSDRDIVSKLLELKKFERFKEPHKRDSFRRKVSQIRQLYDLRVTKADPTEDIQRLLEQYPEATIMAIAHKLKLKYPHLKIKTLENKIGIIKKYGII